jgi:hypothetical protein
MNDENKLYAMGNIYEKSIAITKNYKKELTNE